MNKSKWLLVLFLIAPFIVLYIADLDKYLTLEYFKSQQAAIMAYYHAHPWRTILWYSLVYMLTAVLSLPGALYTTVYAGAIFGVFKGTIIVAIAASVGATLTFLAARYWLRDLIQKRFADHLQPVNEGIERDGVFYLFGLRLLPIGPFFVINLLLGLTPIGIAEYIVVGFFGMLPGTFVYVNAGTRIAELETLSGIFTPKMIVSFVLLGVFPLLVKKFVEGFLVVSKEN